MSAYESALLNSPANQRFGRTAYRDDEPFQKIAKELEPHPGKQVATSTLCRVIGFTAQLGQPILFSILKNVSHNISSQDLRDLSTYEQIVASLNNTYPQGSR